MQKNLNYRKLTQEEIHRLETQGCSALDWDMVTVEDGFCPARIRNTHFSGPVSVGKHTGNVDSDSGVEKISGIFNAYISNCRIGRNVRIANIGVHIANYIIEDNACIENVGLMETSPGSTFGNGTEVEVLNEAGGREVILFNELSVQFAHILCLHRYRPRTIEQLQKFARDYVETVRSDWGRIGSAAQIRSVGKIKNVNIGTAAVVHEASSLVNGTVLSTCDAPTIIGNEVIADNFIIAESAHVADGAVLKNTFVGQGCQMGRQFSSENSLFFANCEAFHGEACSVFAGPYTVTHHKSTLLIAGLFSFYNAGSGSNQSNHMYKLGPVHEGRLGRGTKTGSFSYMMWPCCVGPFGVVLGKHTGTFDTSDYPFTHHEARPDGKCQIVPGLNLITVGTVRDGAKWPNRDRRQGNNKRDIISFDVFSPLTVGKMINASQNLKKLQETTDRSIEQVNLGGALIKRPLLRTGQKFYRTGIDIYLLEKIFGRIDAVLDGSLDDIRAALADDPQAVYDRDWVDIGGQIMSRRRLTELEDSIESGRIADLQSLHKELEKIHSSYSQDEWAWIKAAYQELYETNLDNITPELLTQLAQAYLKVRKKFITMVIADAEKEFAELSQTGFGQDGCEKDLQNDFTAVRGDCEQNSFIRQMKDELTNLENQVETFLKKASNINL